MQERGLPERFCDLDVVQRHDARLRVAFIVPWAVRRS
jgi:hypothetical protein